MAGPTIARAEIGVSADGSAVPGQVRKIAGSIDDDLTKSMEKTGNKSGKAFGGKFGDSAESTIKQKIGKNLDNALLDAFDGAGKKSGGAFSSGFGSSSMAGVDRTVQLVIKLIASIGPQLATIGSALSANLIAIASSALIGLGGALIALAPVAIAAGGALALFVTDFKNMKKTVPGLQGALDGLTSAWKAQASALGKEVGPALRDLLKDMTAVMKQSGFGAAIGASVAQITKAFDEVVKSTGFASFVDEMSNTIPSALTGFGVGIAKLTQALLTMFGQVGPLAANLGSDFAAWATSVQEASDKAAASGGFTKFFDAAYASFQALMGVLGPLTLALGNVFLAAEPSGDRLLTTLGGLATKFLDWTNSIEGKNSLAKWFEQGEGIFNRLLDVIGTIGTSLADLVTPQTISQVEKFLDNIRLIIPKISELLGVIGSGDALNVFANAIIGATTALDPFLPLLQLLADTLADMPPETIQALGAAFAVMFAAFKVGQLVTAIGALSTLSTVILELRTAPTIIMGIRGAWAALSAAFGLSPIGLIIIAIVALVAALVIFFTKTETGRKIVAAAWEGIQAAAQAVASWFTGTFIPAITGVWDAITSGAQAVGQWFADVWQGIRDAPSAVLAWFNGTLLPGIQAVWDGIKDGIQAVGDFFGDVWQGILDAPGNVLAWFQGTFIPFMQSLPGLLLQGLIAYVQFWIALPGRIIGALATFLAWIIEWGVTITTALINWVSEMIPKVVTFFTELPGKIIAAISAFGGMLVGWINTAWNTMYDIVVGLVTAYINFWVELPGRIIAALTALGGMLADWFTAAWDGLVAIVTAAVTAYIDFWLKLPQRIIDALSALGGMLGTFFTTIWNNLKTNVSNGIDTILTFFRELPGKIISALGSLLGTIGRIFTDAMGEGNRAALEGIGKLLTTVGEIPGKILSAIGNLSRTLYNAGSDIIQGFLDGLKAGFEKVKSWVGGIGSWIADHKGPKSYDLRLLQPAGGWIMSGLQTGLLAQLPALRSTMSQITDAMQIGSLGAGLGVDGFRNVSGANGQVSGGRTVNLASGAVVVTVPTDNPEQAANAVLDRLVARWK